MSTGTAQLPAAEPVPPDAAPPSISHLMRASIARLLQRTVSRPLVPIAFGYAIGCSFGNSQTILLNVAALLGVVGLGFLWRCGRRRALLLALFLVGASLGIGRTIVSNARSNILARELPRLADVRGTVSTEPSIRPYSESFIIDAGGSKVFVTLSALAAGAVAHGVEVGDTVTVSGLLESAPAAAGTGSGSWARWLAIQGVTTEMHVRAPDGLLIERPASNPFRRAAFALRKKSEQILGSALSQDDATALDAILFADRSDLSPATASAFATTGTAHLLATAGLHVGILVLVLQWFLQRLTVPRRLSAALCIGIVWLYAAMAGGRPAVVRAAFVASVYFAAILIERIPDLLSALALCALVLLWLNPRAIFDPGFQLTFATVLAIVAMMPVLMQAWDVLLASLTASGKRRHFLRQVLEVETLSIAAQAGAAPLVAVYFNLVSVYGLPANLTAVPLMFLLVPISLITLTTGEISLPAADWIGHWLLAPVLHALLSAVEGVANLAHCSVSVESPGALVVALYYSILFVGCLGLQVCMAAAKAVRDDSRRRDLDRNAEEGVEQ